MAITCHNTHLQAALVTVNFLIDLCRNYHHWQYSVLITWTSALICSRRFLDYFPPDNAADQMKWGKLFEMIRMSYTSTFQCAFAKTSVPALLIFMLLAKSKKLLAAASAKNPSQLVFFVIVCAWSRNGICHPIIVAFYNCRIFIDKCFLAEPQKPNH